MSWREPIDLIRVPQQSRVFGHHKATVDRVSAWWEKRLAENACTGAIFWLKNHGWADKTHTELSGGLNMRDLSGPELKQRIADMLKNEDSLASLSLSKT